MWHMEVGMSAGSPGCRYPNVLDIDFRHRSLSIRFHVYKAHIKKSPLRWTASLQVHIRRLMCLFRVEKTARL